LEVQDQHFGYLFDMGMPHFMGFNLHLVTDLIQLAASSPSVEPTLSSL
jgi:hypothetical protein